jgi:hypothetical protein
MSMSPDESGKSRAEICDDFIRLTAYRPKPAPAVRDAMKRDSINIAVRALIAARPELDTPETARLMAGLDFLSGAELVAIDAYLWARVEELRDVLREDEARKFWRQVCVDLDRIMPTIN